MLVACSTGPVERGRGAHAAVPRRWPSRSRTCSARCRTTCIQTLLDPLWGKGIQSYFKADEPRGARRRADRAASSSAAPRSVPGRRPRSTCTRWAARSAACPRTRRRSPSARCRSCERASRAGTSPSLADAHIAGRGASSTLPRVPRPAAATSTSSATRRPGESGYGPEAYERLVALKREYDPTNVFRLNQNIEP